MDFVPNLRCAHVTLRTLLSECAIKKTDAAPGPALEEWQYYRVPSILKRILEINIC